MSQHSAAWVRAAWGYFRATITDASKGSVPTKKKFSDLVFLKRRFFQDPDCPWAVHAALDKSSIRAMLEFQHEDEEFPARVQGALRFAMHWGRSHFEKVMRIIAQVPSVLRCVGHVPTYDDQLHDWFDKMEFS